MIAAWMLSAVLVGLLVTAGASAADTMFTSVRRPVRFVWLAAMLVTAAWPAAAYVRAHRAGPAVTPAPLATGVQRAATIVVRASERALHIPFDTVLLAGWALLSTLLCARTLYALATLRTRGRQWRAHSVDGVAVRLSRDVGPAVVGLGSMDVVLPEWALDLDVPLRSLVLRHEQEHRRARDPHLLLMSALLSILMPWNVALWWQSRRLRLAIELDCDARVLRADPRPERYGLLLLAIAQRRTASHSLLAPALSEPTSNLERRINAMRIPLQAPSRTRLALLGAVAVTTIVVACTVDAPPSPTAAKPAPPDGQLHVKAPQTGDTVTLIFETPAGPRTAKAFLSLDGDLKSEVRGALRLSDKVKPEVLDTAIANALTPGFRHADRVREERMKQPVIERDEVTYHEFQVEKSATQIAGVGIPSYPANLKAQGIEGEVLAEFVVDTLGTAVPNSIKILKATHPEFGNAVRAALPNMRFIPAEIGGRKVMEVLQVPFAFSMH